jgi:hypothetical protein
MTVNNAIYVRRKGDGEMVAFLFWKGAIGPFLLLEHKTHHPSTSRNFELSEQAVSPLEMRLLTVLGSNNSEGDVLEPTRYDYHRSERCQKRPL